MRNAYNVRNERYTCVGCVNYGCDSDLDYNYPYIATSVDSDQSTHIMRLILVYARPICHFIRKLSVLRDSFTTILVKISCGAYTV